MSWCWGKAIRNGKCNQAPFSLDPKDRIEWHFSLHNESILSLDDILVKSFQPFVPHLYQNTLLLVHKT